MARSRTFAPARLVILGLPMALMLCGHCGTSAQGTEACRSIEQARCVAAVECGAVAEEAACLRAVNTRCLHGLALEALPGQVSLRQCVDAIESAGRCAQRLGAGAAPCDCRELSNPEPSGETICELVLEPERLSPCRFLLGEDAPPAADSECAAPDAGIPPLPDAG